MKLIVTTLTTRDWPSILYVPLATLSLLMVKDSLSSLLACPAADPGQRDRQEPVPLPVSGNSPAMRVDAACCSLRVQGPEPFRPAPDHDLITRMTWVRYCASLGVRRAGSLACSSQRRTDSASRAWGRARKADVSAGLNSPPCSSRLRTEAVDRDL